MSSHLKYRPDIDGLRAIAVLGVVIFHAFPKAMPGGFCGVDIFFVISGYLISGILYKGVREGCFSPSSFFLEFYARRVRRLFPSLIVVMLLCLGYGYFVLLSDEYQQLGMHVAAGTLFIQNFVFWGESGYFDVAASLKPLLHLWSLAVEEQFYIIFPPLLLLIWKRKWPMVVILSILLAASLIANLVVSSESREADFFLTPFRAWEFLGGSLLAWWHYGKSHEEEAPYGNMLSVIGLILVAASMILLKEKQPYPGWRAILPVAGSIAFIAAGKQSWINRRILSNPLVIWIGLISYPLYLFHWPALSFVHIIKGSNPDPRYIWSALGVAFLLTTATYYMIERPVRFSKARWAVPLLTAAFILTGILGMLVWRKGIHAKVSPRVDLVVRAMKDRDFFKGWPVNQKSDKVLFCGIGGAGKQTLFLGDSNTWQYAPRITNLVRENPGGDHGFMMLGSGGVPPIPGLENPKYPKSKNLMKRFTKLLAQEPRIKVIVLGARWDLYFSPVEKLPFACDGSPLYECKGRTAAIENLGRLIADLVKGGKQVVLLLGVPSGHEFDPKHIFMRKFTGFEIIGFEKISKKQYEEKYCEGDWRSLMSRVATESGATVIDPMDHLVSDGFLLVENQDGPIRYDEGHLRPGYVREYVRYLDPVIKP